MRGFSFQSAEPAAPDFDELSSSLSLRAEGSRVAKTKKAKGTKAAEAKIDPAFLAKARELRDRWMERVNGSLALPAVIGKYDVSRTLPVLSAVEGSEAEGHRLASRVHIEEAPMRRLAG